MIDGSDGVRTLRPAGPRGSSSERSISTVRSVARRGGACRADGANDSDENLFFKADVHPTRYAKKDAFEGVRSAGRVRYLELKGFFNDGVPEHSHRMILILTERTPVRLRRLRRGCGRQNECLVTSMVVGGSRLHAGSAARCGRALRFVGSWPDYPAFAPASVRPAFRPKVPKRCWCPPETATGTQSRALPFAV